MDWEAIGAIGEMVGAAAVVATLFYLAIQLRQNTTALKVSAFQSWGEQVNQFNLRNTDPEFAVVTQRAFADPSQLTDVEWVQIYAYALGMMHVFESLYEGYRAGMVTPQLWEAEVNSLRYWLATPVITRWWEENPMAFSKDFREFIDDLRASIDVGEVPPSFSQSPWRRDNEQRA